MSEVESSLPPRLTDEQLAAIEKRSWTGLGSRTMLGHADARDLLAEVLRLRERETALTAALADLIERCERGGTALGNCVIRLSELESARGVLNDN